MKWLDIASTTTNNTAGGCDRQAMVVFRNRAYKPDAVLEYTRIDPAGPRYEQPLLVGSYARQDQSLLAMSTRLPGQRARGDRGDRGARGACGARGDRALSGRA